MQAERQKDEQADCNTLHPFTGQCKVVNSASLKRQKQNLRIVRLECAPMPNVMVALPNIGGALCSMPQSLADAHYLSAVEISWGACRTFQTWILNAH